MFKVLFIICVFILIFKILIPMFKPDDNKYFIGFMYKDILRNKKDIKDE